MVVTDAARAAEPAAAPLHEVAVFRQQARTTHQVVRRNVDGLTHEESLVQPDPGGNCLNWVVGHLVWASNGACRVLGQEPALDESSAKRYERGGAPVLEAADAIDLGRLLAAWDAGADRIDAGLGTLTPEVLDRPAPGSPTGNPNETIRSLLGTMMFHQAYHAGQTALLRRIAGHEGAIR